MSFQVAFTCELFVAFWSVADISDAKMDAVDVFFQMRLLVVSFGTVNAVHEVLILIFLDDSMESLAMLEQLTFMSEWQSA